MACLVLGSLHESPPVLSAFERGPVVCHAHFTDEGTNAGEVKKPQSCMGGQ